MTVNEPLELKSIFARRRRFLIGLGVFSFLFLGIWLILPFLLERYAVSTIRDLGFGEVSLKVENLGPWGTRISDASLADDKTSLSINEVVVRYQPTRAMDGRFHALTLDQPKLEIDLKSWLKGLESSNDSSGANSANLEETIRSLIRDPILNRFRLRNSLTTLLWDDYRVTAGIDALMRAGKDFLYLDLNGSLLETPVSATASISLEGNRTELVSAIELPQLSLLQLASKPYLDDLETNSSLPFDVLNGSFRGSGKAVVKDKGLTHPFVEGTFDSLSLVAFGRKVFSPKIFALAQLVDDKNLDLSLSGITESNGTGRAESWKADLFLDDNACEVKFSAESLETYEPLPKMSFSNLRMPTWRIPLSEPGKLPLGESKSLSFDAFSFLKEGIAFNLYQGKLGVSFPKVGRAYGVRVSPSYAVFPLHDVAIQNFSYSGIVEPFSEPYLSLPQSISGDSILWGDESLLEDFAVGFRLAGLSKMLVDSLALSFMQNAFELNPAKLTLVQSKEGAAFLDFNESTLSMPANDVQLNGLSSLIKFASLNPLATDGAQELQFDSIRVGNLPVTAGRVLFSLDRNGSLVVHEGSVKFLGGTLKLETTSSKIFDGKFSLLIRLSEIDGAQLASLFEDFDGELEGTFSGLLPVSIESGLDFTGGFIEMIPATLGRLRYRSDNLLTEGMRPKGAEYKLRRRTELALKNLDVSRIRLDFIRENGKPLIQGQVLGKSQIDSKTTVNLNYRPRIDADLWELIREIDFKSFKSL